MSNQDRQHPGLSVVIPTLNAAGSLSATLSSLSVGWDLIEEVILADGGSSDDTKRFAQGEKVIWLSCDRGRGAQLSAGAQRAKGAKILFLHADTRLSENWPQAVKNWSDGDTQEFAGVFALRLDDPDPRARRVERLAQWRGRVLGLPYGDQGLLISKALYQSIGGFRTMRLMEDVDLVRRIGKRRLRLLPAEAITSASRYRREGWLRRPLRNLSILTLYFLGLPNSLLVRLYG